MPTARAARAEEVGCTFPIVLLAELVIDEWLEWFPMGVIDDFVPRRFEAPFWPLRIELPPVAFLSVTSEDDLLAW